MSLSERPAARREPDSPVGSEPPISKPCIYIYAHIYASRQPTVTVTVTVAHITTMHAQQGSISISISVPVAAIQKYQDEDTAATRGGAGWYGVARDTKREWNVHCVEARGERDGPSETLLIEQGDLASIAIVLWSLSSVISPSARQACNHA